VRERRRASAEELALDEDAQESVALNLMLAVQICVDIGSHVIADEGWPPAASVAETFERLREHGVLSTKTAEALRNAAGLRNVVAHAYDRIDLGALHAGAMSGLEDLNAFAREVAGWVTTRASG
jgi:uncharacterized protein YutE (UPF0331/DUF86 family)